MSLCIWIEVGQAAGLPKRRQASGLPHKVVPLGKRHLLKAVMALFPPDRRLFLRNAGCGFGAIALAAMLGEEGLLAEESKSPDPLAPKKPHFEPTAKRVIFLFMSGGPSQVDTFDPKPELTRLHGQPLPASFGPV